MFELFSLSGFLFVLLRQSGLIFNRLVTTPLATCMVTGFTPTGVPRAACGRVQCNANAIIYPFKSASM